MPSYFFFNEISLSRLSLVGPHGRRANTRNSTLLGNGFFSIAQTNWSFSHSLQPDVNKPLKRRQGLVVACTELLYNRYCHTVYLRPITSRATWGLFTLSQSELTDGCSCELYAIRIVNSHRKRVNIKRKESLSHAHYRC